MDTDLEQLVDEFIEIALVARGQSLSLPVRENRNSIEMTNHSDVNDIPLRGDPADRIQDPRLRCWLPGAPCCAWAYGAAK